MILYLNTLVIVLVTFFWSSAYWLGESNLWQVERLMSLDLAQPWVYRQLVPILVRGVAYLGVPLDVALVLVVTLSGVGFYLAVRKLALEFYDLSNWQEIGIVAGYSVSILLLGYNRLPYDLMTACLFALALLYMWTAESGKYLLVFTLSCLNRETTFLLILLYVAFLLFSRKSIIFWRIFKTAIVQIVIYGTITYALRVVFADNSGAGLWVEPWLNILRFVNNPYTTMLHISVASVVLWLVFRGEPDKPTFWLFSFALFAPVLTVMYLVCGQAFEVRVFWELAPLAIVLSLPKP